MPECTTVRGRLHKRHGGTFALDMPIDSRIFHKTCPANLAMMILLQGRVKAMARKSDTGLQYDLSIANGALHH